MKFRLLADLQMERYDTKIHDTLDRKKFLIEIYPN
jgi:hypothetical protein